MKAESTALRRQGHSHKNKGLVCQDYARAVEETELGITILALSDGHGSPKYFRSDRGAQIAVDTAIEAVREFVNEFTPDRYLPEIHETIQQGTLYEYPTPASAKAEDIFRHLGRAIIYTWHRRVMADWATDAPTKDEIGKLSPDDQNYYYKADERTLRTRIPKAYGCTLQVAVLAPDYWFALHVGDGKIVAATRDGRIYEPVIWDQKCFSTTTTSLCETSPEEVRYTYGRNLDDVCAMFLASDGTDDSFADFTELASFYGTNVLADIYKNGWEAFEDKLPKLLDYLSRTRSGDDMSMSLWVDIDKIPGMMPRILREDIKRVEGKILMYEKTLEQNQQEIQSYRDRERPIKDRLEDNEQDSGLLAAMRELVAKLNMQKRSKPISDSIERSDRDAASEIANLNAELNKIGVEIHLREKAIAKCQELLKRAKAELDRLKDDYEKLGKDGLPDIKADIITNGTPDIKAKIVTDGTPDIKAEIITDGTPDIKADTINVDDPEKPTDPITKDTDGTKISETDLDELA